MKIAKICCKVVIVAGTLYACLALVVGSLRLIEHREPPACCTDNADCPLVPSL